MKGLSIGDGDTKNDAMLMLMLAASLSFACALSFVCCAGGGWREERADGRIEKAREKEKNKKGEIWREG
jgi:hypothetical protein